MKSKVNILLLEAFYIPLYLVYLFLICNYLNLFLLPTKLLTLLVQYDPTWTIILWIIMLLPFFAFFLYLPGRRSTHIPIVATVAALTFGIITTDTTLGVTSAYFFVREKHTIEVQASNSEVIPFIDNGVACQKIVFLPTQNHLKQILVTQSEAHTALSKPALEAMRTSDFAYLTLPEINLPGTSVLINNTLYLTSIDHSLFEQIGMPLAQKLTSCTTPAASNAKLPQYTLLSTEKYQEIRKAEILEDIKDINAAIHDIDTTIKEYEAWLKQGWGIYNKSKSSTILSYIRQAEKDISTLRQYRAEYVTWKERLSEDSESVIQESGVFIPPNTIHVEFIENNPEYYADHMVSTMLHEYLHYYSHNNNKSLPSFFTEGMTEIINIDTKLANGIAVTQHTYATQVFILRIIAQDVGYKNLVSAYFSKDETQLQKLLDQVYGKDFYKNTRPTFELLATLPTDETYDEINTLMAMMKHNLITPEEVLAYPGYDLPFREFGKK